MQIYFLEIINEIRVCGLFLNEMNITWAYFEVQLLHKNMNILIDLLKQIIDKPSFHNHADIAITNMNLIFIAKMVI